MFANTLDKRQALSTFSQLDSSSQQSQNPSSTSDCDAQLPLSWVSHFLLVIECLPKVIEYNCRFGDPETQPIMMRMESDLVELCLMAIDEKLNQAESKWDPRASIGVVLAAGGYPLEYAKGDVISLPNSPLSNQKIFHAGTARNDSGKIVTNGGRVLCAVALGDTVSQAQKQAYELVETISWDGMFYRNDIGYRAIEREKA